MKHRIEIPIHVVEDGVPVCGGPIVLHVEATSPQRAIEIVAGAIDALVRIDGRSRHRKENASR